MTLIDLAKRVAKLRAVHDEDNFAAIRIGRVRGERDVLREGSAGEKNALLGAAVRNLELETRLVTQALARRSVEAGVAPIEYLARITGHRLSDEQAEMVTRLCWLRPDASANASSSRSRS